MTIEERSEVRAKCVKRHGFDYTIPEALAAEIEAVVARGWHIRSVEFTCHRLTFDVMPRADVSSKSRWDLEAELSRVYGNRPHTLATTFDLYRLTFCAN